MIDAYVVKIIGDGLIPLHYWYRKKVGHLFVCTFNREGCYYTLFNDDIEVRCIDQEHAKVITKFQTEDDY